MKFQIRSNHILVILFILVLAMSLLSEPSGKISGKKPPPNRCTKENNSDCGIQGESYTTYKRSPPVSRRTKATLTINSFEKGGDGGGPSECDNKFHSDNDLIVALSTRWFNNKQRCLKKITIYGNGRKVNAMVVDECRCKNIVDASKAVWKALGVPQKDWGQLDVYWSDA